MKLAIWIYVALIFVFAIYGTWFGDYAFKGFAANLGRALFWPGILFPSLGKALGAVVLLAFIGWLTFFKKA